MNIRFKNALERKPQATPPIWFMRQAGRYHSHYQALRAKHSFMELCQNPELAAAVALGPILDFDFDVAILFSDILFPLDALGMELSYSDQHGPKLGRPLTLDTLQSLAGVDSALQKLKFQGEALQQTRKILPPDKSLIGFVGGLWTLFVYALEGGHSGNLTLAKTHQRLFRQFMEILFPLIQKNIKDQIDHGAEVVMIFDTAGGELSPVAFRQLLEPYLIQLAQAFPQRLGYYAKTVSPEYYSQEMRTAAWAGFGFDHRTQLASALAADRHGFIQGNFDQSFLFLEQEDFLNELQRYLEPLRGLSMEQRAGWVCGLGHGVLPKTPEQNVRLFVQKIREVFS